MIGFIFVIVAVLGFLGIGYTLLMGNFFIFMNTTIILAIIGIVAIALYGLLWEFWFQKPVKTLIANRRCGAWDWVVDDLGYAYLTPSKSIHPHGLVLWKFGWSLLPRPMRKFDFIEKITSGKRRGRPPKDEKKREEVEEQYQARQRQLAEYKIKEQELAEKIGLMKCTWKDMGKPVWFTYYGLAQNFNLQSLVPGVIKQDNPHEHIQQLRDYVKGLASLGKEVREDFLKKIDDLETRVDHVRVVIDPRAIKEVMPQMVTQGQMEDHGRIHEEIGKLSVTGIPMKYIVMVLLVVGVVGALAAVYVFFIQPSLKTENPQQVSALLQLLLHRLRGQ